MRNNSAQRRKLQDGVIEPFLALIRQASTSGPTRPVGPDNVFWDGFDPIRRVFHQGVVQALKGQTLNSESAAFASGSVEFSAVFMEGQAMGAGLLDQLMPWREPAWEALARSAMDKHPYEVHTGLGMSIGVLNARASTLLKLPNVDEFMWWFVVDGYGFEQGLFDPRRIVDNRQLPDLTGLPDYAYSVFDQGVGRSLWFCYSGDCDQVAQAVAGFSPERQANLWVGVGVAATHTGGATQSQLSEMLRNSGEHRLQLAIGSAISCHVRHLGGTQAKHTDLGCSVFCGSTSPEVATSVQEAMLEARAGSTGRDDVHRLWQSLLINKLSKRTHFSSFSS